MSKTISPQHAPSQPASAGKTIVILSTEPWGKMMLSKMHYALVLAARGNRVFFVNPPRDSNQRGLAEIARSNDAGLPAEVMGLIDRGLLTIVNLKTVRGSLLFRHKVPFVFRMISRRYAKAIRKLAIGSRAGAGAGAGPGAAGPGVETGAGSGTTWGADVDEVWCFNPHVFVDLRAFGKGKSILLLYDFYRGAHVFQAASTADAIISVSKLILDHYAGCAAPQLLLQHGLAKAFSGRAEKKLRATSYELREETGAGVGAGRTGGKVRIGYMGNLLRVGMNTEVAREIILGHSDKEFHFWGPSSLEGNNVTGAATDLDPDMRSFIEFLHQKKNVILHGIQDQEKLAAGLADMDGFLFLYSPSKEMNSASNSHKLLEYLSTGKVVVSSHVSNYAGTDLLVMCDREKEEELKGLFDEVMAHLDEYNGRARQEKRISFALENTYERQVERIQQFIYK